MNTTRKGNAKELATQRILEERGWLVGSRRHIGGAGDVLAYRPGEAWLIEVKATKAGPYHSFSPEDRSAMLDAAAQVGARAMLAWWPPRSPEPRFIASDDWPRR